MNNTKPTLLVLAAGMASRYGSLKQMDGVGPNNEAIIDYSIFDAVRAGFGKVVFVIRHLFEEQFRAAFPPERFGNNIEVDYVFQELDYLPKGYSVPEGRVKPWGTNHAVMMGHEVINEPFAVINADDFYGRDAYRTICDYLVTMNGKSNQYCMVGYCLRNTLSDFGTVSRGECTVDSNGNLTGMVERLNIERLADGTVIYADAEGQHPIDENCPVSMNMFGFTPDYFAHSDKLFRTFLDDPANQSNPKSEFFIPLAVNTLINNKVATMRVLKSDAQWFGVTYKEDKPDVVARIAKLIEKGEYPSKLWK